MTTPRELITGALRLINVVQANEVPTAADIDISFEALNAMLDSWSNERLSIYSMNPYEFEFKAGQKEYTLGIDGDWDIERPMEPQMMYVMYDANGGHCEVPIPPPPIVEDEVLDTFSNTDFDNIAPPYRSDDGSEWLITNAFDYWFDEPNEPIEVYVLTGESLIVDFEGFGEHIAPTVYPSRGTDTTDIFTMTIDFTSLEDDRYGFEFGFLADFTTGEAYVINCRQESSFFSVELIRITPDESFSLGILETSNAISGSVITVKSDGATKTISIMEDDVEQTMTVEDDTYTRGAVFMNLYDIASSSDFGTRAEINKFEIKWTQVPQLKVSLTNNTAGFTVDQVVGSVPFNVTFTPYASSLISGVEWNFGDGETAQSAANQSITHTYTKEGRFQTSARIILGGAEFDSIPFDTGVWDNNTVLDVLGPMIIALTPYIEIPIEKLTYDQFGAIGVKSTTSIFPYKWYDDCDYPLRTISVWPVPTMCHKVKLWLWQPLINIYDLDTDIIFPKGYERALRFALAVELGSEFGKQVSPLVGRTAIASKSMIKRLNSAPQIMTGDYAIASNGRKLFNYILGDSIPTNM